MAEYDEKYAFVLSNEKEPSKKDVVKAIQESGADMLLNYLPVGSEEAVKFYADVRTRGRCRHGQQYAGFHCKR